MLDGPIGLASELIEGWMRGGRPLRYTLATAVAFVGVAMIFSILGDAGITDKEVADIAAAGLGVIAAILAFGVISYQRALQLTQQHRKIEEVERRYEENPQETQAAWDLARIKLENYLDRNLVQVKAIFWLTVLVVLFGFILIGYGVINAYSSQGNLYPSILSTVSGVIVNFIGATFLVVYKSTMQQAKDYMAIVERINAVGMSVQILESLSDSSAELREKSAAELSKQLLQLYTKN